MARVSLTIEADDVDDYQQALWQLVGVEPEKAEDVDAEETGEDLWTDEQIRSLWPKLADDAKLVLGIISDYMTDSDFVSRKDLFDELKKYPDVRAKTGAGFGGTLSSYGSAARSLGLRKKNEKLYQSDESGYTMRKEYASIVLQLFVEWLKTNKKKKL